MSDSRPYIFFFVASVAVSGCASTRRKDQTPIGASHGPYPAKPEYLGTRALPDPATLRPGMRQAPIHIAGSSAAEPVDVSGDDADLPDQTQADPQAAPSQQQAAPQRGGSLTVSPSNEAPLPNRLPDQQQPWQPTVIAPNPPQDSP